MTSEFAAMSAAKAASEALDALAIKLRAVGTATARQHAAQAAGAAKMARNWANELRKLHAAKRRSRVDELTEEELADCGLLSELDG